MKMLLFQVGLLLAMLGVAALYPSPAGAIPGEQQTRYDRLLEEGRSQSPTEVDRLIGAMPEEADEIRTMNRLLWSRDLEGAKEAIRYFASLKAGRLVALALEHPADWVQAQAAASLEEIGDKTFVPQLLRTLRTSDVIPRGGTEQQMERTDLIRGLISALPRLTEQDFGEVDVRDFKQVNTVIAKCEAWLAQHSLRFAYVDLARWPAVWVREVAESLGCQLRWNAKETACTISNEDGLHLRLVQGSPTAKLNGETVSLVAAPVIIDGRMYAPLGFLASVLGFDFSIDSDSQTAYIWPASANAEGTPTTTEPSTQPTD